MSRLEADEIVHTALRAAIAKLESDGLSGPEIRERKHFDPAARLAFSVLTGSTVRSVKLTTPHFPGLGSVDIGIRKPPLLIELKWSYDERRSKIFESVWDAIKLVLLAAEYRCIGYIATGASMRAWRTCESRELFTGPVVDPRDLWALPLMPRGPNKWWANRRRGSRPWKPFTKQAVDRARRHHDCSAASDRSQRRL